MCVFVDILSADRQLAREIEYDLKKFEEEETKAKEANLSRPPTLTPHAPLVSGAFLSCYCHRDVLILLCLWPSAYNEVCM